MLKNIFALFEDLYSKIPLNKKKCKIQTVNELPILKYQNT